MSWLAILSFFGGLPGKVKLYAGIAIAAVVAVGFAVLEVFGAGKRSEQAKELERARKQNEVVQGRIDSGIQAGNESESDSSAGKLHDDDGFKRKS